MTNNLSEEEKNKKDALKLFDHASALQKDTTDQAVTISAGIIGVSVTFLNVTSLSCLNKLLLISSWVCLSLGIIFWLIHRFVWIDDILKNAVQFYLNKYKQKKFTKWESIYHPTLEFGPSIALCLGLLLLVAFGCSLIFK